MSFISNILSLPILVVIGILSQEFNSAMLITEISSWHQIIICLSCICGFLLSVSAFMLNKLISATALMVANNVNKFGVIIASEIWFGPSLSLMSTLGASLVLLFGWTFASAHWISSFDFFSFKIQIFALTCLSIFVVSEMTQLTRISTQLFGNM